MLHQQKKTPTFGTTCISFNGHPPLGVNATISTIPPMRRSGTGFNGHPPLGVNATILIHPNERTAGALSFQWAPTLWGECYGIVYLITPPLCQGVNALLNNSKRL